MIDSIEKVNRIVDAVFSVGILSKMPMGWFMDQLKKQVYDPMNSRTPSGKRRSSLYLCGYAQGRIDRYREEIWRNHVEFCYVVDGVIYSTHKTSTHRLTEEFYAAGTGHVLGDSPRGHFWLGTDKEY